MLQWVALFALINGAILAGMALVLAIEWVLGVLERRRLGK